MTTTASPGRFRDQAITFAGGAAGRTIDVPSASPRTYHQAVSAPAEMPRTIIDGKLFLPPGAAATGRLPLVIVVPGSLGVAPSHLAHAETLTGAGMAAFVLDPFGGRGVTSTVAHQKRVPHRPPEIPFLAYTTRLITLR